ncbi:MAG: pentapeptide repeat-containing protein, partial [Actinomycetes bacterium]
MRLPVWVAGLSVMALAAGFGGVAGPAHAVDDPPVYRDCGNIKIEPGADLHGCQLDRAHLRGADLDQARLEHADLRDANLRSANLRGADLSDADLRDAILDGANLN